MLSLPQITDDQHVTRAALIGLYDRIALGLGEVERYHQLDLPWGQTEPPDERSRRALSPIPTHDRGRGPQ